MSTTPGALTTRVRDHRLFGVGVGAVSVLVALQHGAYALGRLLHVSTVRNLQEQLAGSPEHDVADIDGSRIATALSIDLVLVAVCLVVAVLAVREVRGGTGRHLVAGLLVVLVVGMVGLVGVTRMSSGPGL